MDNDNLSNKNRPEHEETSNARLRTQSECSATSDDGNSVTGKRQRTTSQQFMLMSSMTASSPPKFVSLEEIMHAANGMKDMALVHQIVVDENFCLQKADPPSNTVQKVVKDTMYKAFWDILRSELAEDPPNYTKALVLLEEIKTGLFSLLLPQHTKIKTQISEILDSHLIKQQAENGTLDFPHYAQYVTSVMAKLCAPVRDEKIQELTQKTDVIETFKEILETLDLMELDMANFTLKVVRPDIIARSVELERKKFADLLAIQPDGLAETRSWLLKHLNRDEPLGSDYETSIRAYVKKAFGRACIDLLNWEEGKPYPETFMLDESRLREIQTQTNRLTAIGTILLVTLSNVGSDLQTISSFKSSLKEHIFILLQAVTCDKNLEELLPNVADQIVVDVRKGQKDHHLTEMNETSEKALIQQIIEVKNPDHRIRRLIVQRINEFFHNIIDSSTAAPQQVPSGLSSLQNELTTIAGQFLRIVTHNSTVFGIYYYDIVAMAIPNLTTAN